MYDDDDGEPEPVHPPAWLGVGIFAAILTTAWLALQWL
jgi:hypothetical protein